MTTKVSSVTISVPRVTQRSTGTTSTRHTVTYGTSVIGSDQPNWRQIAAQGGDATGSLVVDASRCLNARVGSARVDYWDLDGSGNPSVRQYESFTGCLAPLTIPASAGVPTVHASNRALVSLLSQVRDTTRGFEGVTFLGELRDTVMQVRQPMRALREGLGKYLGNVYSRARRHRQRYPSQGQQAKAVVDMVSGTYLEFVFGAQPLLNDVMDATQALARLVADGPPARALLVGRGSDESRGTSASDQLSANYVTYRLTMNETRRNTFKYRACYTPTVKGLEAAANPLERAKQMFGFTWADFVPSLWNCLPYSFIVDYFANVGDILECGFTARDSLSWVSSTDFKSTVRISQCVFDSERCKTNVTSKRFISASSPPGHLGQTIVERTSIVRTRGVTLPLIPSFEASLPGMRQNFNLAALFAQQTDIRNLYRRG